MGVNQVLIGDEVKLDLTADTVSEDNLLAGATAHNAAGEPIVGAVVTVPVDSELSETSANAIQNKAVAKAIKGGNSLSGSTGYTVTDSVDYPIVGLKVFGKSTQDGTPTPENPVEIVSVVEPTVTVCGKNLLDVSNCIKATNVVTALNNDVISFKKVSTSLWSSTYIGKFYHKKGENIHFKIEYLPYGRFGFSNSPTEYPKSGTYIYNKNNMPLHTITSDTSTEIEYDGYVYVWYCTDINFSQAKEFTTTLQIELGSTATPYEPFKGNTLTLPYTLNAIPVSSGGNVVIDGQEYIADYVDFEKGVKVQRVKKIVFDGSEIWARYQNTFFYTKINDLIKSDNYIGKILCDSYITVKSHHECLLNNITISGYLDSNNSFPNDNWIYINNQSFVDADGLKSALSSNPITVIYELATPIETPLSESELQAYRQLQTYNGTTNISNDKGAGLSVEYCTNKALSACVMPVTKDLQKQIDDLKAAVLSLGGNV